MTSIAKTHEPTRIEQCIASSGGRMARIGLGLALVVTGLAFVSRPAGLVLAALGLVPISTGVFNLCPIAPFWGGHLFGSQYCRTK